MIDRVVVRPLSEDELAALDEAMPAARPSVHRERWATQADGAGTYFVVWLGGRPVGHLLVRWQGALDEFIVARVSGCPYLEGAAVVPALQSCGIGSRLLEVAAEEANRREYRRIGLAVGVGNVRARALYERHGYSDAGFGEFWVQWPYLDQDGQVRWEGETCVYLIKSLD